ncbi:DUF92 domain-containing protein [Mucilaginibacter sp. UR6-11]|uniref:DUF92 domain-containing protein n=1 Tax=Mucilaginibacter sp. UR6-11 TaxID=1435644 RepID=UPI001E5A9F86|nr:DUF92 domain-containing protein [Mucilaginibacter sp. UR6-11]MCC8424200.1 DUF92 domain-containing protein [Mucilaginibacter sp. UR6-11]
MPAADVIIYILLLTGAALSFITRKLTLTGAITGAVVGLLIYKGAGYTGLAMLALFFIAGSWATGWRVNQKEAIGAAEKNTGRRTAGQVLANGGTAALLGGIAWYFPACTAVVELMIAGSFAAATADTLSSELGTIYGRQFFNILTFKKDMRGLDGVVSWEGTLIGLAGAFLIAIVYAVSFGWGVSVCWIVLAGFIGNLVDSVLGALLERKGLMGNNMVNFLNTVVGAGVCWLVS